MRHTVTLAMVVGTYVVSGFLLDGLPNDGCKDTGVNCAAYGKGICADIAIINWVAANCPIYCGFCNCYDNHNIECQNLQSFCTDDAFQNTLCRKTCNTCVDTYSPETYVRNHGGHLTSSSTLVTTKMSPDPTTKNATFTQAPTTAVTTTTESVTQSTTREPMTTIAHILTSTLPTYFGCEDHENCSKLDSDGSGELCTNIFLRQWVATNCPRYCGFCSCYDTSDTCSKMTQFCGNVVVSTNCRESCELCVNRYNPDVFLEHFPSPVSTIPTTTTTTRELPTTYTESPLHFRQCSHSSLVLDIAMNVSISDPRADPCPGGSTTSSLAVLYHYCQPPADRQHWVKTMKIKDNCPRVPPYSPIAAFDGQGNIEIAAVFVRCLTDGFLIVLQRCTDYMHFVPITPTTTGYPPIDDYYLLAWR